MADLRYFDQAFLYNKHSDNINFIRWFEMFLNSTFSCGGALIPDELPKEEREVMLIERAKSEVKKCMIFFNRKKIIDIPVSMIYVVPEKEKYVSFFVKGLIVERSSNECYFAAKVFQEIFCRTAFCQVVSDENKRIYYADAGTAILKKGIASLLAREFIECSIAEGELSSDGFSEKLFDSESEKMLNLFLRDFCLQEENLSNDDCLNIFIEAIINEKSFSQILKERKANYAGPEFLTKTKQKASSTS